MIHRSAPLVAPPALGGLQMPAEAWAELARDHAEEDLARPIRHPALLKMRLLEAEEIARTGAARRAC